ncbi:hypothetical protein M438DRAFT_130308 [Aureobasidium pullulans EXF-150]|uniref:Uncharacterized protein n=1 Tax=Aureobasidium pullulans EXF-150 TaxID=1043002 RepID=A0A074XVQ2_AURPU|nr:uncharacterized protein M438DRAFT_130308 [Aureobasidium pullulans EXF-150]KEQ87689.1 hypothetical protein M438DRAFT_130308 [Aureobasidium pullulans EXF-150]
MYGRADGMPSFQLTVAVCAGVENLLVYNHWFVTSREAYYMSDRKIEKRKPTESIDRFGKHDLPSTDC